MRVPVVSVEELMAYEEGELNADQEKELFKKLVTSGMINGLQGFYQRRARTLIETGQIKLKGGN